MKVPPWEGRRDTSAREDWKVERSSWAYFYVWGCLQVVGIFQSSIELELFKSSLRRQGMDVRRRRGASICIGCSILSLRGGRRDELPRGVWELQTWWRSLAGDVGWTGRRGMLRREREDLVGVSWKVDWAFREAGWTVDREGFDRRWNLRNRNTTANTKRNGDKFKVVRQCQ